MRGDYRTEQTGQLKLFFSGVRKEEMAEGGVVMREEKGFLESLLKNPGYIRILRQHRRGAGGVFSVSGRGHYICGERYVVFLKDDLSGGSEDQILIHEWDGVRPDRNVMDNFLFIVYNVIHDARDISWMDKEKADVELCSSFMNKYLPRLFSLFPEAKMALTFERGNVYLSCIYQEPFIFKPFLGEDLLVVGGYMTNFEDTIYVDTGLFYVCSRLVTCGRMLVSENRMILMGEALSLDENWAVILVERESGNL